MKFLFFLFLLFSLTVHAEFFSGTDIPLMDGMTVDENEGFSFDTPAGQIMTISAVSTSSKKEILDFYKESLKALGWQQKSDKEYHRDQDELTLQLTSLKGKTILKLQLTFANK